HPARASLSALMTKVRRVKGGQLAQPSKRERLIWAARAFAPPARAWWRIMRRPGFSAGQKLGAALVQARLWLTEMAEVLRLLTGARSFRGPPGARSLHRAPSTRTGGIASISALLPLAWLLGMAGGRPFALLLGGGLLVFAVSLLDDAFGVPVLRRLAVHFLAA